MLNRELTADARLKERSDGSLFTDKRNLARKIARANPSPMKLVALTYEHELIQPEDH